MSPARNANNGISGRIERNLQGHLYVLALPGTDFVLERDPVENGASVKSRENALWMGKIWISRIGEDDRYGEHFPEGKVLDSPRWKEEERSGAKGASEGKDVILFSRVPSPAPCFA